MNEWPFIFFFLISLTDWGNSKCGTQCLNTVPFPVHFKKNTKFPTRPAKFYSIWSLLPYSPSFWGALTLTHHELTILASIWLPYHANYFLILDPFRKCFIFHECFVFQDLSMASFSHSKYLNFLSCILFFALDLFLSSGITYLFISLSTGIISP